MVDVPPPQIETQPQPHTGRRIFLWVVAIIVLLGIGAAVYAYQTGLLIVQPNVPGILEPQVEKAHFALVYVRAQVTDRSNPNSFVYKSSLISYDPITKAKREIEQVDKYIYSASAQSTTATESGVLYYGSYLSGTTGLYRAVGNQAGLLDPGYFSDGGMVFLSADGTRGAWCSRPGGITVYDFVANKPIPLRTKISCGLGIYIQGLSRDGSVLYYSKGFYEMYGDFTPEEVRQLSLKAKNGDHALHIATGEDEWLKDDGAAFLWDNANVNLKEHFVVTPTVFNATWPAVIEVRQLSGVFDRMTKNEFALLPILATIQIPGRNFGEYQLTADGAGIFYHMTTARPDGSGEDLRNEFGYYDISSKTNHFPISNIPNSDSRIVAALSSDALFYTGGTYVNGNTVYSLYRVDVNGNNEILESDAYSITVVQVRREPEIQ